MGTLTKPLWFLTQSAFLFFSGKQLMNFDHGSSRDLL